MAANEALLIIDYTNDFVADKGALTCGKAGQVLDPHIVALADRFENDNSWVILPTDVHTPNDPYHPETKLFPPHNVRGTWGGNFTAMLRGGLTTTKTMKKCICTTRPVTAPLRARTWTFGCGNATLTPSI